MRNFVFTMAFGCMMQLVSTAQVDEKGLGNPVKDKVRKIHFSLDLADERESVLDKQTIGIRGNISPLSWNRSLPLTDKDGNGIYEVCIQLEATALPAKIEYKYFHDSDNWEKSGNRILLVSNQDTTMSVADRWNAGPVHQQAVDDSILHKELYNTIARMDSLLFDAYNRHDVNKIKEFFTEDLEFYHDKGGLTNFEQNMNAFKTNFEKSKDINRQLVKGSMEVYPVKDYGAMQIGAHRFCHTENGKQDCGTFRFAMVWQNKNGNWKISRVLSYDH